MAVTKTNGPGYANDSHSTMPPSVRVDGCALSYSGFRGFLTRHPDHIWSGRLPISYSLQHNNLPQRLSFNPSARPSVILSYA